ncbi:MAG: hypothetical protein U0T82_04260 [Bacteroidales bacterium]
MATEAEIDGVLRGVFRVMIKLGYRSTEMVPYAAIKDGPNPG